MLIILSQVLRWIDPLAEYLLLSSKDSQGPKDISAWVLRSFSENTVDYSTPGHVATRLAHFFIANMHLLLCLQVFLRDDIEVPARPSTPKELSLKALEDTYPGAEKTIKAMHADMKKLSPTAITSNHWTLDCYSHNPWRQNTKNRDRDWLKYAIAAFVEEKIVAQYRATLLSECAAAGTLRQLLKELLTLGLRKQGRVVPGKKTTGIRVYTFPDGLSHADPEDVSTEDIDTVILQLTSTSALKNTSKEIKKVKRAILQIPAAHLTPRVKTPNPKIAALVAQLEHVSAIVHQCCLYIY